MKNNVMLDLETMDTGTNAAIIAVGAVCFDSEVYDKFYKIIDLQSCIDAGLSISGDTVMWWMQQSEQAREQFKTEGVSLASCLRMFSDWIGENALVWGNGAAFDNAILSNAYQCLSLKQPWKFYNDRCYRTMKSLHPDIKIERSGIYHCAVDDAETQARHLIKILSAENI